MPFMISGMIQSTEGLEHCPNFISYTAKVIIELFWIDDCPRGRYRFGQEMSQIVL